MQGGGFDLLLAGGHSGGVASVLLAGWGAGTRTGLGVLTGLVGWILEAALGLTAVSPAIQDGYPAIRTGGGAAYVLYIGLQA